MNQDGEAVMDRERTVSQRMLGTEGCVLGLISTQNYLPPRHAGSLARLLHALALAALRLQPRRKGVVRCMFRTLCGAVGPWEEDPRLRNAALL
jgi:hypothetical protein